MGLGLFLCLTVLSLESRALDQTIGNELIVKYRGVHPTRMFSAQGVYRYSNALGATGAVEHLKFESAAAANQARRVLEQDASVLYVEPNRAVSLAEVPSHEQSHLCFIPGVSFLCFQSPLKLAPTEAVRPFLQPAFAFNQPNGVKDPGRVNQYGLRKIRAATVWGKARRSAPVVVAVLDSGVDYNHEDLGLNLWRNPEFGPEEEAIGYDFVHNDPLPYDDSGHGTHVAGIIGAVANNGIGIAGVSPRVLMMILKFIPNQGDATLANALRAFDYAISHGARIINNSWYIRALEDNRAFRDAVESAHLHGVLVVTSVGNDGVDLDAPGGFVPATLGGEGLIAVAASNSSDELAAWSNYGAVTSHLAAPGQSIYSTLPGNSYGVKSGTSMAVPHVTGAAALLWSLHPNWSHLQIQEAVLDSVDRLPSLSGRVLTGGRLNIQRAIQ